MSATIRELSSASARAPLVSRRIAASNAATEAFFSANVDSIAHACQAMAGQFHRGGRLLLIGNERSDIAHAVVEFVHPVIVGKRALPAVALPNCGASGVSQLFKAFARPHDILFSIDSRADDSTSRQLHELARQEQLLTIALTGAVTHDDAGLSASFRFAVPSHDPCVVQETHEILYHVLWELVHVFFEHGALDA